jgi:branched-chain amino acid transport system substrate-binding protein
VGRIARQAEPFRVGLTRSTSGDYVFASTMGFRGLKLWQQNINEEGGLETADGQREVELVFYDDRSEEQRTVRLYNQLARQDDVDVVFGPFGSTLTAAAASVANAQDMFLLSWSAASPEIFEQGYENIVSVNPTAPQITRGEILGMAEVGVETLATIHLNAEFPTEQARGIEQFANEQGIDLVYKESFPSSMSDFSSLLDTVDSENPDAFYPVAYLDSLVNMAQQMKANDIMFDWTSMTYSADPDFHESLGEDAKYFFGHTIYHPEIGYDVTAGIGPQEFYNQFKETYADQTPSYIGALGYAGGVMLQRFVEEAGSTETSALKQAALDLSGDVTTLIGNYELQENGVQTGFLYTATQNQSTEGELYDKIEVVAPEDVRTAEPMYPIPGWNER